MKGEINRDWYCLVDTFKNGKCYRGHIKSPCYGISGCNFCHRKHPTPEQFKEEYGEEYSDDGAVYYGLSFLENFSWSVGTYEQAINSPITLYIVCACTPWGKPPNDWRPNIE